MTTPNPSSFASAEPVVTAGAAVAGLVTVTGSVLELLEAFGLVELTARQDRALTAVVVVLAALLAGMIARRKVVPSWKLAALEALVVPEAPIQAGTVVINGPGSGAPETPQGLGDPPVDVGTPETA